MIRLLLIVAIVLGAIYLVRWFLRTPAETVAAHIRKTLWLILGLGLIFLAVTGRLNIIFAFIGSAIPLIVKHLPNILRLLGVAKSIKSAADENSTSSHPITQTMNATQALEILGLTVGATDKEIIDAHKRLIQKLHPDKGGSEYMSAQLNLAKETLLKHNDH